MAEEEEVTGRKGERMKNKPCPFCAFDIQGELFYYDKWKGIVICRQDEHHFLAVRIGVRNHKPLPTLEEREDLMVPLIAVTVAHIKNGKASGYDIDEIVDSDHYHYFCNIT